MVTTRLRIGATVVRPWCQPGRVPGPVNPRLVRWRDPQVLLLAAYVGAAGFCQFGVIAALGDVAEGLGGEGPGDTIAAQVGLSGTALGVGLAVIRLASLAALPLAGAADRLGRRRTLRWWCGLGVALTALAAFSPTYAVFVAVFAVSRPLLTATNTIAGVAAAEQTASADRAKAMALVAAAYGVGSGLVAVLRGVAGDALGFRAVFALALVPLVLVTALGPRLAEPDRWAGLDDADRTVPVLGAVAPAFRRRLALLAGVMVAISVVTGPANSFFFLYLEDVLDQAPGTSAVLVVAAGLFGLVGLLVGRLAADRLGRRPTAAVAVVAVPLAGVVTYSGSVPAAAVGYLAAVLVGSAFLPAFGALQAESFPTEVRAAVAGWLVVAGVVGAFLGLLAFGLVADAGDHFAAAAGLVFTPMALAAACLLRVPETVGRELEDVTFPQD